MRRPGSRQRQGLRCGSGRWFWDFWAVFFGLCSDWSLAADAVIVDFRSFDTLGEIVVVAVACIAGVALIRSRKSWK